MITYLSYSLLALGISALAISAKIISITPKAVAYEPSVFSAYPLIVWIGLVVASSCGITSLVLHSFAKKGKLWIVGLTLTLATNITVLLVPFLRGYPIYGQADALSHLGYIKDISIYGTTGFSNTAPVSHLIASGLSTITGIDSRVIVLLAPTVAYIIYMTGVILLAKAILKDKGMFFMALALAGILPYNCYSVIFLPSMLAFSIIPITLWLLIKSRLSVTGKYGIPALIIMLTLPFTHTTETASLIIVLAVAGAVYTFRQQYKVTKELIVLCLVLGIPLLIWLLTHPTFYGALLSVLHKASPIETYTDIVSRANLPNLELIGLVFTSHGHQFILLGIAGLTSVFMLWRKPPKLTILSYCFLIFVLLTVVVIFNYVVIGNPIRIIKWAILISIFLGSIGIYKTALRLKRPIALGIISITLVGMSAIGIFSTYTSVLGNLANPQVTQEEINKFSYFLKTMNRDIPVTCNNADFINRIQHMIEGSNSSSNTRVILDKMRLPSHFGYDNHQTLGEQLSGDRYIIIRSWDIAYAQALPEKARVNAWQWNKEDIEMLWTDPTVTPFLVGKDINIFYCHKGE